MTQLEYALKGKITEEMYTVAKEEQVDPDDLRDLIAAGKVVIPANPNHAGRHPYGIGIPLKTKVNANIGTSENNTSIEHELMKLEVVEELVGRTVLEVNVYVIDIHTPAVESRRRRTLE